jgi:hypothetical protein
MAEAYRIALLHGRRGDDFQASDCRNTESRSTVLIPLADFGGALINLSLAGPVVSPG